MLAAHMQLAEGILRHVGRLQHHLIEQVVVAARRVFDVGFGDRVGRSAGLRLDAAAGDRPVSAL